jgi:hypothetical protein
MTPVLGFVEGLARGLAARVYALLFRLLIAVVPEAGELDVMLEMLDGERDEWSD